MRKIKLNTSDGIKIVGSLSQIETAKHAIILLHMMPETKESWDDFSEKLNDNGYTTLAIDLRGHGESQDGPDGYKSFTDKEHQESYFDVEASIDFLEEYGIECKNISIIGASIGANLAIETLAEYKDIKKAVVLSPGLNYKGLMTDQSILELRETQKVLLVASDDDNYSFTTIKKLKEIKSNNIEIEELHNAGHGTNMLINSPQLMDKIINWLK